MCNHLFEYPIDTRENYNHDMKTLTGICRYCGAKQKALGYRGIESLIERYRPYGYLEYIDNPDTFVLE
uniref:Uncharacterized protein n=1 Tax=viral metagenome TaxID=1070528 RepID=A0A6H2A4M3_9ZZZZ